MVMIMVMIMVIMVHLLERLGRGATMAPGNSLSVTAVNKSSSIVTAKANSLWIFLPLVPSPPCCPLTPNIFKLRMRVLDFAVKFSSYVSSIHGHHRGDHYHYPAPHLLAKGLPSQLADSAIPHV